MYAALDADGDGRAEDVVIVAEGLYMPSGVAFLDGAHYVAEVNRILRFADIANNFRDQPEPEVWFDALPADAHHGWKFIAFSPDGWLYVPIGTPCNAARYMRLLDRA